MTNESRLLDAVQGYREEIIALTLTTVAVSIVLHGISVTPLMNLYARRKAKHSSR